MVRWIPAVLAAAALAAAGTHAGPRPAQEKKPMVKKLTPVLFVAEIEPCVKFWTEQLGFTKTVEVPEGNKIGFVILVKGNVELMYQSYASADKDAPAMSAIARKGPTFLYIEVENLEAIKPAIKGAEVVMAERTTFYGAREIGIKDPGGHYLTFAQLAPVPQH
ncbi:MAG TPA: VOC family protein [Candidatus Solibacter sp.]|nr:VOC family protein [Candidatus Solibacter sp.]